MVLSTCAARTRVKQWLVQLYAQKQVVLRVNYHLMRIGFEIVLTKCAIFEIGAFTFPSGTTCELFTGDSSRTQPLRINSLGHETVSS